MSHPFGFPLVSKDVIKGSLFDSLGQVAADPLVSSRRLGAAAMPALAGRVQTALGQLLDTQHLSEEAEAPRLAPHPGPPFVPHNGVEHRLVAADASARRTDALERRLEAVTPMTTERWDSLAIEDLTEDEAEAFWQAIAG